MRLLRAVVVVLVLGTRAWAVGPVVEVVLPSAWAALCGDDTSEVIIRATSDRPLTAASVTFDAPIGSAAAGTVFPVKPPPGGGLMEVMLPVATNLWGVTMTVVVTDKGGRTTTLAYEYSSASMP